MRARDLLHHLRDIESQQQLADKYGGRVEQTGVGFWLWRPPSGEAWEARVKDQEPAREAALAAFREQYDGPARTRPAAPPAEPEETPRERRRRLRIANRDKRITWA